MPRHRGWTRQERNRFDWGFRGAPLRRHGGRRTHWASRGRISNLGRRALAEDATQQVGHVAGAGLLQNAGAVASTVRARAASATGFATILDGQRTDLVIQLIDDPALWLPAGGDHLLPAAASRMTVYRSMQTILQSAGPAAMSANPNATSPTPRPIRSASSARTSTASKISPATSGSGPRPASWARVSARWSKVPAARS